MELFGSNIKKFLIFSLIFWEMETPKKFNIFQKTELFYISGNFLYLRKRLSELEKKAHS